VSDCVSVTLAAVEACPREVYNIGGGDAATVWDIVPKLESRPAIPPRFASKVHDPARSTATFADRTKLQTPRWPD